jgi:hypothetical protein
MCRKGFILRNLRLHLICIFFFIRLSLLFNILVLYFYYLNLFIFFNLKIKKINIFLFSLIAIISLLCNEYNIIYLEEKFKIFLYSVLKV